MRKIFIDTNILLDVAMHRNDFFQQAAIVWADCELRKVQGFISAISLNNMHYVSKRLVSRMSEAGSSKQKSIISSDRQTHLPRH